MNITRTCRLSLLSMIASLSLAGTHARSADSGDALGKSRFLFLGTFSDERLTAEHIYTTQFDLWREGRGVVGLYAQSAGLQGGGLPVLIQRIAGTYNEATRQVVLQHDFNRFGFRFQGKLKGDRLTGQLEESGDKLQIILLKSSDRLGTIAASAPTSSIDEWTRWAEQRLDLQEEKSAQYTQETKACEKRDGWACVGMGNRAQFRGKTEKAKQFWEKACQLGNPAGCKFSGQKERSLELLRSRCSSSVEPSLDRNLACQELGEMSEKRGNVVEVKKWYRLGCNSFELPLTCCSRLKKLSFSSEEVAQLKSDCDRQDNTACFLLAGTAGQKEEETKELYKKACKGMPYACRHQ